MLCLHCTQSFVSVAWHGVAVAFLLVLSKFFLVEVVFVTVVPHCSCCGSSSAGEFLVVLCNAASTSLDQQQLIGGPSNRRLRSIYGNV